MSHANEISIDILRESDRKARLRHAAALRVARRRGGKENLKSAVRADDLPTDHLPKHGTSAASNSLYPSIYGGVTECLRGSWEYLRGHFMNYGEAGSIYGGVFKFTGSCEILRGVLICV